MAEKTLLIDSLRAAELLPADRLDELAKLKEASDPDPVVLGRVLLQRGLLTRFQINLAAQGRGKELRVGRYLLLDKLGEGGMGQVFKARDERMGRLVALKLLKKDKLANDASVKRFYQEVQAAAALQHPNIALAYDADQAGNVHYMAMEYVEGIDLDKQVKEKGALAVPLACEYARQAALALQHAHEAGMIHRDIKPHNLMATKAGGKPAVKLLDMGLARLGQQGETGLTQSGQVLGTPDYLAPEQAMDSRKADIRSDIYSLGCTLYYLLAGQAPFTGESLTQVLLAHQMGQAKPLSEVRDDMPPALLAILKRMMAREPDSRYQTPGEVAEALAPLARGEEGDLPPEIPAKPSKHGDTFADLEDADEVVRVPKRSRSSTRIQEEEDDRPKRRKKEEPKSAAGKYALIGAAIGVPVLALIIGLAIAFSGGKKPEPDKVASKDDKGKEGKKEEKPLPPEKKDDKGKEPPPPSEKFAFKPLHIPGPVSATALAVSPDGRWAATGANREARLYDLKEGKLVAELPQVLEVSSLRFTPDGTRLLAGGSEIVEWDLATRKRIGAGGRPGRFLSPDAAMALAIEEKDGKTQFVLHQVNDGAELRRWESKLKSVASASFARDGKSILVRGNASELQILFLGNSFGSLLHTGPKLRAPIKQAILTLEKFGLVVAYQDGSFRLADARVRTGGKIVSQGGHGVDISSLSISPDGKRLLTAGGDGTVRLWDMADGQELGRWKTKLDWVVALEWLPGATHAIAAGMQKGIEVFDLAAPQEKPVDPVKPPVDPRPSDAAKPLATILLKGTKLAVSPDSKKAVVLQNHPPTLHSIDLTDGKFLFKSVRLKDDPAAHSICWGDDGRLLVGTQIGMMTVDPDTGASVYSWGLMPGPVDVVSFSSDGTRIAAWCRTNKGGGPPVSKLFIYDGKRAKQLREQECEEAAFRGIGFLPGGKRLYVGGRGNRLLLVDSDDAATGKTMELPSRIGDRARPSKDGKLLLCPSQERVAVVDLGSGEDVGKLPPTDIREWSYGPAAFCGDDRFVLASARKWTIKDRMEVTLAQELRLHERGTGKLLFRFDAGTDARVWEMACTPDNKYAVAVSYQGTVRIFDLQAAFAPKK